MIDVSVIIPIYGVEKYIEKCARSLFEQTLKENIEFIFVDDCSPDKSLLILNQIIEKYPKRKHQIRIIKHPKNRGISATRKTGIEASCGKYVIHCDSDDWVEPEIYELLLKEANSSGAEIIRCGHFEEFKDKSVIHLPEIYRNNEDILKDMVTPGGLDSYLWNRLMLRNFCINQYKHRDISLFDDLMIALPLHRDAKITSIIRKPLYHYNRMNLNSITSSISESNVISALKVFRTILKEDYPDNVNRIITRRYNEFAMFYGESLSQYKPDLWRFKYKKEVLVNDLSFGEKISYKLLSHKNDIFNLIIIYLRKLFSKNFIRFIKSNFNYF